MTGPPRIDDVNKIRSRDGKELVSQGRNLSFFQQKALRVRRLYDERRNTVVYVAYSTRLTSASDEGGASTGRYKCAPLAMAQRVSYSHHGACHLGVLRLEHGALQARAMPSSTGVPCCTMRTMCTGPCRTMCTGRYGCPPPPATSPR